MCQQEKNVFKNIYYSSAIEFMKIPGNPVAYWLSQKAFDVFENRDGLVGELARSEGKNVTTNNAKFVRFHWEVNKNKIGSFDKDWLPCAMGGEYRKWYGNIINVIDWSLETRLFYKSAPAGRIIREEFWSLPGITWGKIGSGAASFRFLSSNEMYQETAILQNSESESIYLLALLNSKVANYFLQFLSPTVNFQLEDISSIPTFNMDNIKNKIEEKTKKIISITKEDWNSNEQARRFCNLELLDTVYKNIFLRFSYESFFSHKRELTLKMRRLEVENNRIFIDAYVLQDELTPDVPLHEITLTCNPYYRYSGDLTDQDREHRLQSDTIAELVSYAIGCMMGRYSLDHEGLIYAHAGNEGFTELVANDAYQTFPADEDGIIPLTDQEWFKDDATNLFRDFIKTAWSEGHLQENLDFVAESLCLHAIKPKKGESSLETVRRYLSTQFYKDHLKTYKKRPIYWLFSSGKQKAFECLVYLHRYNEGTLSRMRTEYVTPLLGKYAAYAEQLEKQQDSAGSTAEANRLKKELTALQKKQAELREFDDKLKHYADMRISLDLDDGVKVNYGKFGDLLANVKDITGSAPEVN